MADERTAPNSGSVEWRLDRIERILRRIADDHDPANQIVVLADRGYATEGKPGAGVARIVSEELARG